MSAERTKTAFMNEIRAIIKLLELYIRECDGRIDKTKDNLELIKNNMQALALQLLLHQNPNDNTIADYRLNTARL